GQWVSSTSAGDAPGYVERPAGTTLGTAACGSMNAGYLVTEYGDNNWTAFASETNTLTLTVQPKALGTFTIEVRSSMHFTGGPPCNQVDAVPSSGTSATDQQG